MFGVFGSKDAKKDSKAGSGSLSLTKNWASHIKEIKRQRAIYCQNKGMTISEMGKDLAHIERKSKMLFNFAVAALREGKNADDVFKDLNTNHVGSEVDKLILDGLFVKKQHQ